jgi:hypothetical protein
MKRVGTKLPDGGYQVDIVTDHGRVAERAVYDATGVLVTRSYSEALAVRRQPADGPSGRRTTWARRKRRSNRKTRSSRAT